MDIIIGDPVDKLSHLLKGDPGDIYWVLSMYAIPYGFTGGDYYISETEYSKHKNEFARKGVI